MPRPVLAIVMRPPTALMAFRAPTVPARLLALTAAIARARKLVHLRYSRISIIPVINDAKGFTRVPVEVERPRSVTVISIERGRLRSKQDAQRRRFVGYFNADCQRSRSLARATKI